MTGDPNDPNFRPPATVNPRFFGPLPRAHEMNAIELKNSKISVDEAIQEENHIKAADLNKYTALLGAVTLPPRLLKYLESDQSEDRSKSRTSQSKKPLVFILGGYSTAENKEERGRTLTTGRPQVVNKEHHSGLFTVIDDPRIRRKELSSKRRQEWQEWQEYKRQQKETDESKAFALPSVRDRILTVSMPQGARLSDYQWFGVYDRCRKIRTAYVSLVDVVGPSEKVIEPLLGWKYNISSGPVRILNCDTFLIPNFTFKASASSYPSDSHFYVGIGDFPSYIIQQVRAYIVGARDPEEPLRDYDKEDVVVRLPNAWKTFDVNFLSIYSEKERQAYGHTQVPPVIVPPCDDIITIT